MTKNSQQQVTALQTLTAIALTLPGMDLAHAETQITKPKVSFQYTNYDEKKDRYKINVYQALVELLLGSRTDVAVKATIDTMSGASPSFYWAESIINHNPASVGELIANNSGATIKDRRNALDVSVRHFADEVTATVTANLSEESDTSAYGGSVKLTKDFNKKNTSISVEYGLLGFNLKPTPQASAYKSPRRSHEHKTAQMVSLSLEQILTDKSYITQVFEYAYDHGYLSDPYKFVYSYGDARPYLPGTLDLFTQGFLPLPGAPFGTSHSLSWDHRPSNKSSFVTHTKFVQYIPNLDSSIRFAYRFIRNDWKIKSHTFKVDYIQPFCEDYEASAGVRYYTQGKAKFYAMAFTVLPNPPFDAMPLGKYASSDYRLAKYGDITYELGLSKKFMQNKQGKVSLIGGMIDRRNKFYWGHQDKTPNPSNNFKSYYASLQFSFELG